MDIAHLQHSKNPLERAAYWAVTAGWIDANLFEQAQADSKLYQEMAKGWLPPEVARECWAMLNEIDRYPSPKPPGWTHKFNQFIKRNRAALAALKEDISC